MLLGLLPGSSGDPRFPLSNVFLADLVLAAGHRRPLPGKRCIQACFLQRGVRELDIASLQPSLLFSIFLGLGNLSSMELPINYTWLQLPQYHHMPHSHLD